MSIPVVPIRARQGSWGVVVRPDVYRQINESYGEYFLSDQIGTVTGEPVAWLPDDYTDEQLFDALGSLEQLPRTWAQERDRIDELNRLDALDDD